AHHHPRIVDGHCSGRSQRVPSSFREPRLRRGRLAAPSEHGRLCARRLSMRAKITVKVNQKACVAEVEPSTLLVEFLREQLRLTGTHVGCATSQCGACVVVVNGKSVKSCTMLAVEADGAEVTTIEGLAQAGELHPIQAAFHAEHALQCG